MGFTTIIAMAALLSLASSHAPFNPEEMLFIFTRCMEDNLKNDASRLPTLLKWRQWENEPSNDESTHCFAKCVLDKTGLYNPSTNKFDANVIRTQATEYPQLAEKIDVDAYADTVEQLPETVNDCTSVFNAYDRVHQSHRTTSKNLFHGNKDLTQKIYDALQDTIRQKDQSYFEFCENKFYAVDSSDRLKLCQIRQYTILNDDVFKRHTDCVMKGVRYITKANELDMDEIKRDFELVGKDTAKLEEVLSECSLNSEAIAWEYYKCLIQSPVADDFKEAFDYREVRSKNYAYNLVKKQVYNKPSVDMQVAEIDGKQCPQAEV